MAFEVINVHVAGPSPTEKKEQIQKDAEAMHLSVSAFMMMLYHDWKKRQEKASSRSKK